MSDIALPLLAPFLVEAKLRTYAGLDDNTTIAEPSIAGSKQLEHARGDLHYRDIYFGMTAFAGLETVAQRGRVVWSMSYSGGIEGESTSAEIARIYTFLRRALLLVGAPLPVRGPPRLEAEGLRYHCTTTGDLAHFSGEEWINDSERRVYGLRFSGGRVA